MLRPLFFALSFAFLGFHGCNTVPTPPAPTETKTGPVLTSAELEFKGRIEAQALAANYAAQTLPDSNGKVAVQGPVGVISTLTSGASTQKQRDEAMVPVLLALQGKLQEATDGWVREKADADAFRARVAQLEAQVTRERQDAAAELTRQLQQARDDARKEADARVRSIISWIFFGGGAFFLLATVGVLYFAPTVPQLGPRVAIFTASCGVSLIASGVAIIQLLDHPVYIWVGMTLFLVSLAAAGVAVWYNHLHAVASGQISTSPVIQPVVKTT